MTLVACDSCRRIVLRVVRSQVYAYHTQYTANLFVQTSTVALRCRVLSHSAATDCPIPLCLEELRRKLIFMPTHPVLNEKHVERTMDAYQPESYTFIASLKDCGKKKDLSRGISVHADILEKGLLRKSSHLASALISMYAKCGVPQRAEQVLEERPVRSIALWNALIAGYVQEGQVHEALKCLERMQTDGFPPDVVTYTCILKACSRTLDVDKGKQIHDEIVRKGFLEKDIILGTTLVDMYAKCGFLAMAKQVLEELPDRNEVSWSALITGYAQHEQGHEALKCLEHMQSEGLSPDAITLSCILKACGSIGAIEKGKQIHDEILSRKLLQKDIVLGNALVDMYAKCGELDKARELVEEIPIRDAVSWCALISGYVQNGQGQEALDCFEQMQSEGLSPNAITFICVLRACGITGALGIGTQIHSEILSRGFLKNDVELGNALVDMYVKCGDLVKAQQVLTCLPVRNTISWSALIAGYADHGKINEAFECFKRMQSDGVSPNSVTFICIFKACGSVGAVNMGQQFHKHIVKRGMLKDDILLGNTLLDMYAKCGTLAKAHQLLEELPVRNTVSWNILIAGFAQIGYCNESLNCFEQMQSEGFAPNEVTCLSILNACCNSGLFEEAQIHYGNMTTNYGVTPDLQHYTCLVAGLGRGGQFDMAVSMIKAMPSINCPAVWVAVLGACRRWGNMKLAKLAFDQAVQIDDNCTSAYILIANIFAAGGMEDDAKKIEAMLTQRACISVDPTEDAGSDNFHVFY